MFIIDTSKCLGIKSYACAHNILQYGLVNQVKFIVLSSNWVNKPNWKEFIWFLRKKIKINKQYISGKINITIIVKTNKLLILIMDHKLFGTATKVKSTNCSKGGLGSNQVKSEKVDLMFRPLEVSVVSSKKISHEVLLMKIFKKKVKNLVIIIKKYLVGS